jgi:hypothetical protein
LVQPTYILDWRMAHVELHDRTRMFRIVGFDFAGTEIIFSCVSESAAAALLKLLDTCVTHAVIERQPSRA